MRIFTVTYTLFAKRLRLSNPWNYKVPALLSVTYLMMILLAMPWENALEAMAWSMCTILGIAGFGYLSNDLGDRKADRKAGKPNLVAEISITSILGLMGLLLTMALLPWLLFFPLNLLTGTLLSAEFLLFVLYVLPPFRLKERGLWGVVTDALYAHVNPALLAALTFAALCGKRPMDLWPLLVALGLWQLALGMRNILLHQLKDVHNDHKSGIQTFVTRHGAAATHRWMGRFFVPLELLTWLLMLFVLTPITWLPLVGWPIYVAWQFPRKRAPLDLRGWLYLYLDDFYIPILPLLVLASLVAMDWRMVFIAVIHVLLLKSALSPVRDRLFSFFRRPT